MLRKHNRRFAEEKCIIIQLMKDFSVKLSPLTPLGCQFVKKWFPWLPAAILCRKKSILRPFCCFRLEVQSFSCRFFNIPRKKPVIFLFLFRYLTNLSDQKASCRKVYYLLSGKNHYRICHLNSEQRSIKRV